MREVVLLLCCFCLLSSCTSRKGIKVKFEIEDSIALQYELEIENDKVIDTIYKLDNKIKLSITPRKPSDIISITLVSFEGEYYSCSGGYNLSVYPIEREEVDRFVPYHGRNVMIKDDYCYYYYGILHCIEKEDKNQIRDYFKKKGKSRDNLIEGITLKEFKRDLPRYYEKYLNNKGDSISIDFRKVRKFFKSGDYIEQKYIIDYNQSFFEN
ncbi:hypothetical protein [Myroides sp. TSA_177.3]|uniref:hypothetical protein n=1 Tax=Myroides sp. TSA_177.3 TaxID=3415650 RepID=UPI0040463A94